MTPMTKVNDARIDIKPYGLVAREAQYMDRKPMLPPTTVPMIHMASCRAGIEAVRI